MNGWVKLAIIVLWVVVMGVAAWTTLKYWKDDKTAAWTSLGLVIVLIAAFVALLVLLR